MAFFTAQQCLNQMLGTTALDATQALNQILGQAPPTWGGTSTGSADAQAIAPSRAITAYAAGQIFAFKAGYTNTGAATLAVSGLTAKAIQQNGAALGAGDLTAGQTYIVTYDGTYFQLFRQAVAMGDIPSGIDAAKIADGSVSNAEFQRLDGVTSNIQSQIDGKASSSHTHAASDLASGTIATSRLGSGSASSSTFLRGDQSWAVLAAADIPSLAASKITSGQLGQAQGGTGADLSATGGTSQVLKQISAGAAITVAQLTLADLAAGTLGVSLQLGSASDSPASSVAYVRYNGTSLISNVPTSKDHRATVNGVLQAQVSAGSGQVGPSPTFVSNASQGAVAWSSSSVIANTYEGSTTQGYSAITSGIQTVTLEAATNFISGATQAKFRAVGNATTPYCEILCGNAIQQTFNANGIQLNTGAGSVTAATRGIYQTSGGVVINTPTSTTVALGVNGTNIVTVAASSVKSTTGTNVVINTAALATSATDGFLYLPTCAGTPTGVPTANTGTCAFVYDTTNNKLYVYNGAWKATAALT